jgi:hypothetical protein
VEDFLRGAKLLVELRGKLIVFHRQKGGKPMNTVEKFVRVFSYVCEEENKSSMLILF